MIASKMYFQKGFLRKEKLGSGTVYRRKVEKETEPVSKTGSGGTRAEVFDSRDLTFMVSRNSSATLYLSSHLFQERVCHFSSKWEVYDAIYINFVTFESRII